MSPSQLRAYLPRPAGMTNADTPGAPLQAWAHGANVASQVDECVVQRGGFLVDGHRIVHGGNKTPQKSVNVRALGIFPMRAFTCY